MLALRVRRTRAFFQPKPHLFFSPLHPQLQHRQQQQSTGSSPTQSQLLAVAPQVASITHSLQELLGHSEAYQSRLAEFEAAYAAETQRSEELRGQLEDMTLQANQQLQAAPQSRRR